MPLDANGMPLWPTTGTPPYIGATLVTPGTPVTGGRGVIATCSAAGNVRFKMQNGSVLNIPMTAGQVLMLDNISVTDVVAASTTATVAVSVLL